jgi:hypothetical protein
MISSKNKSKVIWSSLKNSNMQTTEGSPCSYLTITRIAAVNYQDMSKMHILRSLEEMRMDRKLPIQALTQWLYKLCSTKKILLHWWKSEIITAVLHLFLSTTRILTLEALYTLTQTSITQMIIKQCKITILKTFPFLTIWPQPIIWAQWLNSLIIQ